MLAEVYVLIDISQSAASWCDLSSQHQLKFIQHQHFYLSLFTGLDVTQNISTAESPDRCVQLETYKIFQQGRPMKYHIVFIYLLLLTSCFRFNGRITIQNAKASNLK